MSTSNVSIPDWAQARIERAFARRLMELDLSGSYRTNLVEIPAQIFTLTWLERLILSHNQLTTLPEAIAQLSSLTHLYLSHNQLTTLPESILQLLNLTVLDLDSNQLTVVPEDISRLFSLTRLYLNDNQLTTIPETINRLSSLIHLYLSRNQLTAVPQWLVTLPKLERLYLNGNPVEVPPPEILNLNQDGSIDLEKVRNYHRQLQETGKDHLYEAKLLIVGEAGAGKTSLAQKLLNRNYRLKVDEPSTEGIDIFHYEFPLSTGAKTSSSLTFRLNIWDFGGQEIYHATHQFFLTRRSLYLLVADAREQKTDFYYWLNIVELLGDHSPVLIVVNEKQERLWAIPESQLRGQFRNLVESLDTDLASNRGLEEIHQAIQYHSSRLPHVGDVLPRTWVEVRNALENDSRPHISLGEYLDICKHHGFNRLEDKLQLSGYLHDLGVCLHFQDDPLLKRTLILKPEWGTTAVYKVLDNPAVINNLGRFSRTNLKDIWELEEYALMRDELLQLMIRFGLCYEIPGQPGHYIAPQLLGEDQPTYEWEKGQNLVLRYRYEFMPKGILTRFIVAIHPFIAGPQMVWKSGVILEKEGTRAEVIEHYGRREIHIHVAGPQRRDLLTIVTHEIEKIHATFPRLKYDKLIPCNCAACRTSQSPHFYRFDSLKRRLVVRKLTIECDQSYEMVNVLSLVDDVGQGSQLLADQAGIPLPSLRQHLLDTFSKEELENLCFELGMEYDDLPGEGRADKARELVQYMERHGRLSELIVLVEQLRPGRPLVR